jgi:hypothetical protein
MKAEKKRVGTKAQIRAIKERERRLGIAIFLALILFIAAISIYFTYTFLNQPQNQTSNQTTNPTSSQLKAAIVDQLSLTYPNQTFIQTATNTLKQAGYTVDYYPGEQVTVEFYRNLPTHGYKIIILRVHSSTSEFPTLAFFTSETYSNLKYVGEQLDGQVVCVCFNIEDKEKFFGITPSFVESSINGKFQNTTIIMMGCNGLTYNDMAKALIERGAKIYIGWTRAVSGSYTDQATICLLQHLISEKQTIEQAINNVVVEVGPDPVYQSQLIYYPLEAGEQTIESINGKS